MYKTKGHIIFRLTRDDIEFYTIEDSCTKDIYDLFYGEEFLQHVQSGFITDYDGRIADIFVNGYVSNLGLATDNLTQGKFLVDAGMWKDICDEFTVEVNWANK